MHACIIQPAILPPIYPPSHPICIVPSILLPIQSVFHSSIYLSSLPHPSIPLASIPPHSHSSIFLCIYPSILSISHSSFLSSSLFPPISHITHLPFHLIPPFHYPFNLSSLPPIHLSFLPLIFHYFHSSSPSISPPIILLSRRFFDNFPLTLPSTYLSCNLPTPIHPPMLILSPSLPPSIYRSPLHPSYISPLHPLTLQSILPSTLPSYPSIVLLLLLLLSIIRLLSIIIIYPPSSSPPRIPLFIHEKFKNQLEKLKEAF